MLGFFGYVPRPAPSRPTAGFPGFDGLGAVVSRDGEEVFFSPEERRTLLAVFGSSTLRHDSHAWGKTRVMAHQLGLASGGVTVSAMVDAEEGVKAALRGRIHAGARAQLQRAQAILAQAYSLAETDARGRWDNQAARWRYPSFDGLGAMPPRGAGAKGGMPEFIFKGLDGLGASAFSKVSSCASLASLTAFFEQHKAASQQYQHQHRLTYDSRDAAKQVRALCEANKPRTALELADRLTNLHGIESITSRAGKTTYYVNTGDTYGTTLLWSPGGPLRVGSWGNIVERGGYDGLSGGLGGCGCGTGYGAAGAAEQMITFSAADYQLLASTFAPYYEGTGDALYSVVSLATARRPIPAINVDAAAEVAERLLDPAYQKAARETLTTREAAQLRRALAALRRKVPAR